MWRHRSSTDLATRRVPQTECSPFPQTTCARSAFEDGEELERLVTGCHGKRILEIGTSTGNSTLWLAKAALRTGGYVTTIEIDQSRYQRAKANFDDACVHDLVDARLGDAMTVIPTLGGTIDFVFSDATSSTQPDNGYTEFFRLVEPKIPVGGLFTMHNVTDGYGDDGRFFRYLEGLGTYETRIVRTSRAGISISRKLGCPALRIRTAQPPLVHLHVDSL